MVSVVCTVVVRCGARDSGRRGVGPQKASRGGVGRSWGALGGGDGDGLDLGAWTTAWGELMMPMGPAEPWQAWMLQAPPGLCCCRMEIRAGFRSGTSTNSSPSTSPSPPTSPSSSPPPHSLSCPPSLVHAPRDSPWGKERPLLLALRPLSPSPAWSQEPASRGRWGGAHRFASYGGFGPSFPSYL